VIRVLHSKSLCGVQLMLNRLLCAVLLVSVCQSVALADRPNIVMILADDLGVGDVHCYGGERCLIETPNIDALAAGGMRFTDAHVNASICSPTRRAVMTGRYNWRFGANVNSGPWGFVGPRPNTEKSTLGKLLQRVGYRTGYVGKWHLGTTMTTRDGKVQGPANVDFSQPLKYGPVQFGFKESLILPGSLDMFPYALVRNNIWQGDITTKKGWSAFNRVGPAEKDFEDHKVLETFYSEAESFLGRQNKEQPFFLFLALTAPHTPTSPGVNWQGKSQLGVYGDFVMEVDHSVGRVRQALKRHGLDQNTLVMFSSDHGPAPYAGNILEATPAQIHLLEAKGHFSNGPHRGYKFSIYEGGLRVPLIAHWPGVITGGSTCHALVGLNDLFATFSELSEAKYGDDESPDSISFANLLIRPEADAHRQNLIMQSVGAFAVRDGDWKLCLCPGSGTPGTSPVTAGNVPTPEDAWRRALEQFDRTPTVADLEKAPFVQLFNLANDLHEDDNVAVAHPDRVNRMVSLLKEQIENGRSTPGPKLKNDRAVRLIDIADRRLPEFVRQRLNGAGM
jgi:arylsulfatase A